MSVSCASAVGTPVTRRPRRNPGRAVFPHPVPRLYSHSRGPSQLPVTRPSCYGPTVRLARVLRSCMSGTSFLCELRTSVGSFAIWLAFPTSDGFDRNSAQDHVRGKTDATVTHCRDRGCDPRVLARLGTGGRGRLLARGSHRSGRAQLRHLAPRSKAARGPCPCYLCSFRQLRVLLWSC